MNPTIPSTNSFTAPSSAPEISVVVPCLNEAELIEGVVREWSGFLNEHQISFEMIVINDGSSDGSGRILDRLRRELRTLRVIHQLNSGHGRAVRRGYELARGRYLFQVDASGRYEPADFLRLWEHRNEGPLVLAYRTHRLDCLPRRLMAHALRKLTKLLFHSSLKDPNVPFRLFLREASLPYLAQLPPGFFSVNLALGLLIEREHSGTLSEVPVPFRRRARGGSSHKIAMLLTVGLHVLLELLQLRISLLTLRIKLNVPARES